MPRGAGHPAMPALALIVVALLGGIALRGTQALAKRTLLHDEARSYLTAAGNDGRYSALAQARQPAYPFGAWAPAAEWKAFFRVSKPFAFQQIARDLAAHDLHPPLYFWLLHLWSLAVGIHIWTGPLLNLLIAGLTTGALFGLASGLLGNRFQAGVVAALWALSPGAIAASFEARPYDLLALITALFVWRVVELIRGRRRMGWRAAALALTTGCGLLTHYQFVIAIVAAGPLIIWAGWRRGRRHVAVGLAALLAGGWLFLLLFPGCIGQLRGGSLDLPIQPLADVAGRARVTWASLLSFAVPWEPWNVGGPAGAAWLVALTLLLAGLGGLALWWGQRGGRRVHPVPAGRGLVLYFCLALAGAPALLYLLSVNPPHAMGSKYLSMAWPLAAFLPVLLVDALGRDLLYVVLVVLMAAAGVLGVWRTIRQEMGYPDTSAILAQADRLLCDSVAKSVAPRVFWHAGDDTPIFCAAQSYLLRHPEEWIGRLDNALYVSDLRFGGSPERRESILQLIAGRYAAIQRIEGGIFGGQEVFEIYERR